MLYLNNFCLVAIIIIIIICNLSTITVISLNCRSIDRSIINSSSLSSLPSSSGPIDHSWNRYIDEVYNNYDDYSNASTTSTTTSNRDNSSYGPYMVNKTDIQFFYKNAKVKVKSLDWPPQNASNSGLSALSKSIVEKFWTGYSSDRFIAADYSWVEVQRFKVGPLLLKLRSLLMLQLLLLLLLLLKTIDHLSYPSTIYHIHRPSIIYVDPSILSYPSTIYHTHPSIYHIHRFHLSYHHLSSTILCLSFRLAVA